MEYVKVFASLYDKDNVMIGTSYAYPMPHKIDPIGESHFRIIVTRFDVPSLEAIASYKLNTMIQ